MNSSFDFQSRSDIIYGNDTECYYIYDDGADECISCLFIEPTPKEWLVKGRLIIDCATKKEYRRMGYMRRLLQYVVSAQRLRCVPTFIMVKKDAPHIAEFYRSVGFVDYADGGELITLILSSRK